MDGRRVLVGKAVGVPVGFGVGTAIGLLVGLMVFCAVGARVGLAVGLVVGCGVGDCPVIRHTHKHSASQRNPGMVRRGIVTVTVS